MKYLITGGAGFIGSHLAEKLLGSGHDVNIIDDLSTGSLENISGIRNSKKFHCTINSIMNPDVMEDLVAKTDYVVHLAAAVGVKYVIDNPLLALETNINGTGLVLSICNKFKKPVFIASTSEVYGKNDKDALKEDDDRLLGSTHISRWGYAASKAVDEFLGLAYFREKKLDVTIGRFFNIVGPRQSARYGMVIPRMVKQALLGNPITVYGDGKQKRCFTYIDDALEGVVGLMNSETAPGEIFNIGNTAEVTIEELAGRIKKLANSRSKIVYVPYEKAYEKGFEDMKRRKPDLGKIKKFTGYHPKHGLNDILTKTIEYFEA
ncbi:MAG: GDP-mannose 4,6-dehydratase [Candidatus Omnitrophica bacterium]|nr:GDP-mannose 4,6-dehydratase [Candidatus Omnitrophota bacterium]